MAPSFQMVECLQGVTEDPLILQGSFLDEHQIIQSWDSGTCRDTTQRMIVVEIHYCRVLLHLIHDNLEAVPMEINNNGSVKGGILGPYYRKIFHWFHCALSLRGLAHTKQSFERKAQSYIREIQRHAVAGSPTLNTMLLLLTAEKATFRKEPEEAFRLYDRAAEEFEKQSLYLYKAITLERSAKYALTVGKGAERMVTAYNEYHLHGADSKTELMRKRYPSIQFGKNEVPSCIEMALPLP